MNVRKVRKALVALPCACACALVSFASLAEVSPVPQTAQRTVKAVTLPEALTYAHEHLPQLRASLARVAAAKKEADVPRGQWLPVLGVAAEVLVATSNNTTASYLPSVDVDIPRIGGSTGVSQSSATWQPYGSTFVAASITQEAFDFGRIAAQAAAADARAMAALHSADAEKLDVDFGVEEAYFAIYAAKGVYSAASGAYERAKTHRDLAQAGVSSGLRSPIELTRAEADLSRFEIARIRAEGGIADAQTVLAAAVGSSEPALDVSGPAPALPELPSLNEAIQQASVRDPRIQAALARLAAQEKTTTAIGAELRPNLFATATLSGRAGGAPPSGTGESPTGSGWIPDVPNWDVGLVLSWPIFDGVVAARQKASRAAESVQREEVAYAREQEAADIERSWVRLEVAKTALPALKRALEGAVANYAQADARFKAGLGNAVELADAEAIRADAEVQLALGLFEVARARAAFGRAIAEGL